MSSQFREKCAGNFFKFFKLSRSRVMLSGSFTRPVRARKGGTLRADFGPLGSLSVQFV
jgi:2-keto-4-pentenoate hydratase